MEKVFGILQLNFDLTNSISSFEKDIELDNKNTLCCTQGVFSLCIILLFKNQFSIYDLHCLILNIAHTFDPFHLVAGL